jgi:hypothetical protein
VPGVVLAPVGTFAEEAVRTRLLVDEPDRVVIEFRFDTYAWETVTIGDEEYRKLWIPGEAVNLEKGAPDLPHVARSVIVPDDVAVAVAVLSSAYEDSLARIAPSKGNLLRSVDPSTVPYELGAAYGRDELYPSAVAALGRPYIMRDHRGVTVRINPVQYNPVSKVLRVHSRVTVEIATTGTSGTNVLERRGGGRKGGRAWDAIYRRHFLNAGGETHARSSRPLAEDGSMLVICHDPWIPNVAPLVAHKAGHGIPTTIVGVSSIGNDSTAIHDYIRSRPTGGLPSRGSTSTPAAPCETRRPRPTSRTTKGTSFHWCIKQRSVPPVYTVRGLKRRSTGGTLLDPAQESAAVVVGFLYLSSVTRTKPRPTL